MTEKKKKIAQAATKVCDRAHHTVSHYWWWLMLRGLALVVLAGFVLIIWPSTGVVTVAWLPSAIFFLLGGAMVYVPTKLRPIERRDLDSRTVSVLSIEFHAELFCDVN